MKFKDVIKHSVVYPDDLLKSPHYATILMTEQLPNGHWHYRGFDQDYVFAVTCGEGTDLLITNWWVIK
jgi:hypothetical protein